MTWTENLNRLESTLETSYEVWRKFLRFLYNLLHNDKSAYIVSIQIMHIPTSVFCIFWPLPLYYSICLSLYFYLPHGKHSCKSDLGAETRTWEITKHICISVHTFSKSLDGCCNVHWILWKLHKSNTMQVVNFIYRDMLELGTGKHKMLEMQHRYILIGHEENHRIS